MRRLLKTRNAPPRAHHLPSTNPLHRLIGQAQTPVFLQQPPQSSVAAVSTRKTHHISISSTLRTLALRQSSHGPPNQ